MNLNPTLILGRDEQAEAIKDAKRELWERWCSEGAP